jgi:hypothetical protein
MARIRIAARTASRALFGATSRAGGGSRRNSCRADSSSDSRCRLAAQVGQDGVLAGVQGFQPRALGVDIGPGGEAGVVQAVQLGPQVLDLAAGVGGGLAVLARWLRRRSALPADHGRGDGEDQGA